MRGTRAFLIGGVAIGGGVPVTVQSMTNTDTRDAAATLAQVGREGDHLLHAPLVLEIGNADAGVHTAGIGQYRLLRPTHQRVSCAQLPDSLPSPAGSRQRSSSPAAIRAGGSNTRLHTRAD